MKNHKDEIILPFDIIGNFFFIEIQNNGSREQRKAISLENNAEKCREKYNVYINFFGNLVRDSRAFSAVNAMKKLAKLQIM